jgi:hypothetical protein
MMDWMVVSALPDGTEDVERTGRNGDDKRHRPKFTVLR